MLIRNIYTHDSNQQLVLQDLYINQQNEINIFNETTDDVEKEINVAGQLIQLPGLLDSHIHGYGGIDFADKELTVEKLMALTQKLGQQTGLAYCAATIVSLELNQLKKKLKIIDEYFAQQKNRAPGATEILAVHLEGPFIAKSCCGAHDPTILQSEINIDLFTDIINTAPHVTNWKITLTPDLKGAQAFIKDVQNLVINQRKMNVKVFIGHTNAQPEAINNAIINGAIGFTHLGNANEEKASRAQGQIKPTSNVVNWTIDNKNIKHNFAAELITDGEHLSADFVNFLLEKMTADKIILVTDSLGHTGKPDGEYQLGSLHVIKQVTKFVLKDNPEKLAGSAATYDVVIKKFSEMIKKTGTELWKALYPVIILNPRKTVLTPEQTLNDKSNFVILDETGELVFSVVNRKIIKNNLLFKVLENRAIP